MIKRRSLLAGATAFGIIERVIATVADEAACLLLVSELESVDDLCHQAIF